MALPLYLALTGSELEGCDTPPKHTAWMACHFSSYGLGLSNFPKALPDKSLLILNDCIPPQDHDPELVAQQLKELCNSLSVSGILLDFQRPGYACTADIVRAITEESACPVAVTEYYAKDQHCAVFLEAPRAYHSLKSVAAQWAGRDLWLEASFSPGCVGITAEGSRYTPAVDFPTNLPIYRDQRLHCSYCIQKTPTAITYYFHRTPEDLLTLLAEADNLGFTHAVGLYQELVDTLPTQK